MASHKEKKIVMESDGILMFNDNMVRHFPTVGARWQKGVGYRCVRVTQHLPIVVITVAAKITALGQFQLLKVLLPVMVTP